jgi:glycosyltransferase involved in cell wall biosynthesis
MHAKDARKVTAAALLARGRAARCVVACNHDVAGAVRADGVAIHLIPHGVDLGRFRPMALIADSVFRVLAVGRLVEKKGFDVLIRAAARLAVPIAVRIVGEGPERKALEALIASESCVDRVNLAGPLTHDALPREYAWAHAVAVPSVVDATGDRDGLPNVVLEAMASGRPVVATRVGAIDSAVVNGLNGLLVKEGSVESLLEALHHMAAARRMQEAMGARGRSLVERKYGLEQCANNFCRVLENAYAS